MSSALTPGPWGGGDSRDEGTLALAAAPRPGPVGGSPNGSHLDDTGHPGGPGDRPFDWKRLGFSAPPCAAVSDGRHVFRVWGGTSLERGDEKGWGVFFSYERPASQRDAEARFAIMEFGNACTFVSEFEVPPGTPMVIGPVDPGDDVHPNLAAPGEQIFIRNPWAQRLVRVGPPARLERAPGDPHVYSGPNTREPAKDRWN